MKDKITGPIVKMSGAVVGGIVHYSLPIGKESIDMNALIGKNISLKHTGKIICEGCSSLTEKSHKQGYCKSCSDTLAICDMCKMKPELCHYNEGTCREPKWGEENCLVEHVIYLSNTSGVKIGITREIDDTRWIDQGAVQALPIFKVKTRLHSGDIEVAFKEHLADKTNWRTMLKGGNPLVDLKAKAASVLPFVTHVIDDLRLRFGEDAVEVLTDEHVRDFTYPVQQYPEKVTSLSFDKTDLIEGILLGIKGQYLYFSHGVINMRKFTGYELSIGEVDSPVVNAY